jgi:hypothetical protein
VIDRFVTVYLSTDDFWFSREPNRDQGRDGGSRVWRFYLRAAPDVGFFARDDHWHNNQTDRSGVLCLDVPESEAAWLRLLGLAGDP